MSRLDAEEAAILKAFEEGEVTSAADAEDIRARHQQYAQAMADSSSNAPVQIQLPVDEVYYTHRNETLVILLCGGNKSSQTDDIKLAYELLRGLEATDEDRGA